MMKIMQKIMMVCLTVCMLQSCSREPTIKDGHLETVEKKSYGNALFYTGSVQPLKTQVITSPADGVIVDMPFQYGETVKPGQLLFRLSSAKFLTDYKTALMQYIKAKNEFNTGKTQLTEAEFLHKNELISDDEFKSKQTNFYAGQLGLVQAKDALEVLLKQLNVKNINLYNLSIEDIDKVTEALHLQQSSENLEVATSATGVVLSPSKSEEEVKKFLKGDAVKQGDALAMIGDMSGLAIRVKVNELVVNQLHPGQKVKVTGIAFPNDVLNGQIQRVDRQGESVGGAMPNFSVEIIVPKLTEAQQKVIHAGMSAKIEIDVDDEDKIMIPIRAIVAKANETFVERYDVKAGKLIQTAVKTGKTTPDAVVVLSGLSSGDRIVIPN